MSQVIMEKDTQLEEYRLYTEGLQKQNKFRKKKLKELTKLKQELKSKEKKVKELSQKILGMKYSGGSSGDIKQDPE